MAVSAPAFAQGGVGGGNGGGESGINNATGSGGSGGLGITGGGGGGGGAGWQQGGAGGNGSGVFGGTGGAGGVGAGANGSNGSDSTFDGGGGGGGGTHGLLSDLLANAGIVQGGNGGNGGQGSGDSVAGGGGAAGYGAVVTQSGSSSNRGTIVGGTGGAGGKSDAPATTNGGSGGMGILFLSGGTFVNSGTVIGGSGGAGGSDGTPFVVGGGGGNGGAGVSASNMTIVNNGTIAGGSSGGLAFSGSAYLSGGVAGAGISGSNLTIRNSGSISGGSGLLPSAGAAGISGSNVTIFNTGSIAGGGAVSTPGVTTGGGGAGVALSGSAGEVRNGSAGTITGGSGGLGTGSGGAGVTVDVARFIFANDGTVSGGVGSVGNSFLGGGTTPGGSGGAGVESLGAAATLINSGGTSILNGGAGGGGGGNINGLAGAGGAGGAGASVAGAGTSFTNSGRVVGGMGGQGGSTLGGNFAAGGAGGAGVVMMAAGTLLNTGTIVGGSGGAGGGRDGRADGNGGSGGAGVSVTAAGVTLTNSGTVQGGVGGGGAVSGAGGVGVAFGAQGGTLINAGTIAGANALFPAQLAGAGVSGANLTIVNDGAIVGGFGAAQANAVTFTGGTNVLEVQSAPSRIVGNVVAFSAADTLRLGGTGSQVFDTSTIGTSAQFRGFGAFAKTGTGTWRLINTPGQATSWTVAQGTLAIGDGASLGSGTLSFNGGTLQALAPLTLANAVVLGDGGGTFDTNGQSVVVTAALSGSGGLAKNGAGLLTLQGTQRYGGGTIVNQGVLALGGIAGLLPVGGALAVNGGALDMALVANGQSVGALSGTGGLINLGANTLTTTSAASTMLATQIVGAGALVKQGSGTLTLTGSSTYSGGTVVTGGLINFAANANLGAGGIALDGGGLQWASGSAVDVSSRLTLLSRGGVLDTNGNAVTLASAIAGAGGLTKQGNGRLDLAGANTYAGLTSVDGGTLAVNGRVAGDVLVNGGGTLGGVGLIAGSVLAAGTVAPGNSIGTLSVGGNFSQRGGTFQVEIDPTGRSDSLAVAGTATIAGGTLALLKAQSGIYPRNTSYTILSAAGGVSGAYSPVVDSFDLMSPVLTYGPNAITFRLALDPGAFTNAGQTTNQDAVGGVLDQGSGAATGDFSTVIDALANLGNQQAAAALEALGGQPYANFGTTNIAGASLFMNSLGQQMANVRKGGAGPRIALAQACEIEACDDTLRLAAWFSGLGGLGSVQGNGNASTLTYNAGGAAAGIDYRVDPGVLVGLGVGYAHGTQWVNGFMGQGWSDSVSVAAYGSFTQSGFYADALAGFAYIANQMQRQIQIPGLQPRTASGSTGASQFLAQVEAGYRLGVWEMAGVAPFARFQASSTAQNAFTESGAGSLDLNVAPQITTSLRTVLGAELDGTIGAFGLGLRLGWQHEYASTARPVTASFAGAPQAGFTVYGATPARDAAIVGFSATAMVAAATQLYLRYDGEIASGSDNHAVTAGLRLSW